MSDKQTEALKLALETLEDWAGGTQRLNTITAIREALAEQPAQQQEPVGQLQEEAYGRGQVMWFNKPADQSMLYTSPQPSKPWVGLTDEEIKRMAAPLFMSHYWNLCNEFARAIEAKLKENNA